jgi:hypothetical protein
MRRREFIALLGGATAASAIRPTATGAQTPPKIPRVGYIAGSSATATEHMVGLSGKGSESWAMSKGKRSHWKSATPRGVVSGYPSWWLSLSISKWMS